MRTSKVVAAGLLSGVVSLALPAGGVHAGSPAVPFDFNGDGHADLAVGVPFEDVAGAANAGAVHVLYGSSTGLTALADQLWTQNSPGVRGVVEAVHATEGFPAGERFGAHLASGDVDGDGHADLLIGVPLEDGVERSSCEDGDSYSGGAFHVLFGSARGLGASRDQYVTARGLAATLGLAAARIRTLAVGDFDGDGRSDAAAALETLECGAPFKVATVLFDGDPAGLDLAAPHLLPGIAPRVAGDLNGDGLDDLVGNVVDADGAPGVGVCYGAPEGLAAAGCETWTQDSPGIVDEVDHGDGFGAALAIDDFDADGFGDLAVGIPGEHEWPDPESGGVAVIYGSAEGLHADGNQLWTQDTPGVPDRSEAGDAFGASLAAGDFNCDGAADLAVGAPGEDLSARNAGAVTILYGRPGGITALGARRLTQGTSGVPTAVEPGDRFGRALSSGDFGRSRCADLAVAAPNEGLAGLRWVGHVSVLYGRSAGLDGTRAQGWWQGSTGVKGTPERADLFGYELP